MAFPTSINNQITDAVSQSTLSNFGVAGAMHSTMVQQAAAQSLALRMSSAVGVMARLDMLRQAVVAASITASLAPVDGSAAVELPGGAS